MRFKDKHIEAIHWVFDQWESVGWDGNEDFICRVDQREAEFLGLTE